MEMDRESAKYEQDKILTHNTLHVGWHFLVGFVLLPGAVWFRHIDYQEMVRFFASVSFLLWAVAAHEAGQKTWRNVLFVTFVAVNPFFPLELKDRRTREVIQLAALIVAAWSIRLSYRPVPVLPVTRSPRMPVARQEAR